MCFNNLGKIEKEIKKLRDEEENDLVNEERGVFRIGTKGRKQRIENLERDRDFIRDNRREGILNKIFWNMVVPIIVTILTTFALKYFNLIELDSYPERSATQRIGIENK
jgi:hypothetical protein